MDGPSPTLIVVICLIVVLAAVYGFLTVWHRRDQITRTLKQMAVIAIFGLIVYVMFAVNPQTQAAAPSVAILVVVIIWSLRPRRKRGIKAHVRRRVIAKWVAETGKKYNSNTHEIDHIIPFSKGGSDRLENLRVVEKKFNRSRGAKTSWRDLIRR